MTVTEMLLKADTKKVDELNEGTFDSAALARALGKPGKITIKIREIPARKMSEYIDGTVGSETYNTAKMFEASKKIVLAGVIDPDLKNKELQEYFGCHLGIDLVEKIFKNEVYAISEAIQNLSAFNDADDEEIKN